MNKTPVEKYISIARLSNNNSQDNIARICHVSKKTVSNVVKAMKAQDFSSVPSEMAAEDFYNLLFPPASLPLTRKKRLIPDTHEIALLKLKGQSIRSIWLQYCTKATSLSVKHMDYPAFCRYCNSHVNESFDFQVHNDISPGNYIWTGWFNKIDFCDAETGEKLKAHIFLAILPYSSHFFAYAFDNQSLETFISGHIRLFNYLAGIPKILITAVPTIRQKDGSLKKDFSEMAAHYGISVDKPDKQIHSCVQGIKDYLTTYFADYTYTSLETLNSALTDLATKSILNDTGFTDQELFAHKEQHTLKDFQCDYVYKKHIKAKVQYMYHISHEKKYYSVPYDKLGEDVDVVISAKNINISFNGKLLAIHPRLSGNNTGYSTIPEHMPPKGAKVKYNCNYFLSWAHKVGPATKEVIKRILISKTIEQQTYKDCMLILKLENNFITEQACKISLTHDNCPKYKTISDAYKNILAEYQS